MRLKPIQEQVVVIVGATSGIGREAALRFGQRGARVVAAGRSLPALVTLVSEIRQRGGEATAFEADVSDFEQVKSLAEQAFQAYGRIDTWINLAAVTLYAPFSEISPEEFRRVIDVNLMGQVYGAMVALPYLQREGQGALVHVSSVESRQSLPLHTPYTTSKHALIGFIDALRMEIEHENLPIAVTNVMPASINTPLFDKALTRMGAKPRPLPPVYEPGLVADTLLYVAEHPTREIYAGGAGKGIGLMHRLSPRLAEKMFLPVSFRGQKTDQPKSADAPNNLYEHIDGFDSVEGSFGEEAKSASLYTWQATHPSVKLGILASALPAGAVVASGKALRVRRKKGPWYTRLLQRTFR